MQEDQVTLIAHYSFEKKPKDDTFDHDSRLVWVRSDTPEYWRLREKDPRYAPHAVIDEKPKNDFSGTEQLDFLEDAS